jgi:hypothetical protein
MLDYVPASFRIVRHIQSRPVWGCDTEIKAAMPAPPIERGKPGRGSSPMCWSPNTATTCHTEYTLRRNVRNKMPIH